MRTPQNLAFELQLLLFFFFFFFFFFEFVFEKKKQNKPKKNYCCSLSGTEFFDFSIKHCSVTVSNEKKKRRNVHKKAD